MQTDTVSKPITLLTPRLRLRALRETDADTLFRMYSDSAFMRYWAFPPLTAPEQAAENLTAMMKRAAAGSALFLAVELQSTGEAIGTCNFPSIYSPARRAEIGYGLLPTCWGHGYMQEAVAALLDYGFEMLKLHRIEADVDPRNASSVKVLERAGFVREGLLRERWIIADGEYSDGAFYGLLRQDWLASQSK